MEAEKGAGPPPLATDEDLGVGGRHQRVGEQGRVEQGCGEQGRTEMGKGRRRAEMERWRQRSDVIWTVLERIKDSPSPNITLYYRSFDEELGRNDDNILNNTIKIYGSKITLVDDEPIPTGELLSIKGTLFNFLEANLIGSHIGELSARYDINYVIDGAEEQFKKIAKVRKHAMNLMESNSKALIPLLGFGVHTRRRLQNNFDKNPNRKFSNVTRRPMELWANKPGVQFYMGNMLGRENGKEKVVYGAHKRFCLETQGFRDSVNHDNFLSHIVNPRDDLKKLEKLRRVFAEKLREIKESWSSNQSVSNPRYTSLYFKFETSSGGVVPNYGLVVPILRQLCLVRQCIGHNSTKSMEALLYTRHNLSKAGELLAMGKVVPCSWQGPHENGKSTSLRKERLRETIKEGQRGSIECVGGKFHIALLNLSLPLSSRT
ncbi:hypothetical protein Syun_019464 [Stephania yunnanensis]|uniref:Uncharacterized protein n=1 Tax=Stephania yunnanensis TaxID=152371 RepID=A0AAP0IW65_9MAGN